MNLTTEEKAAVADELYHDMRSGACTIRDFDWELSLRIARAERKKARQARSHFARIKTWWGRPRRAEGLSLPRS